MHTVKTKRIIASLSIVAVFSVFNIFPNLVSANDISIESVIRLINESRKKEGIEILKESPILDTIAKDKVKDMLVNDYFAHTSPSGKDPWYWFSQNGYNYAYAGENLAINFKSARAQHEALMKSESHRKNILNSNYSEIGVAVAQGKIDGKETVLVAQVFASPMVGVVDQKSFTENGKVLPAETVNNLIPLVKEATFWEKWDLTPRKGLSLAFFLILLLEIILMIGRKIKKEREKFLLTEIILCSIIQLPKNS